MAFILTAAMLREKNACTSEVEKFESEWPNGLEVHESAIPRIVELGLSIDWFASNFLQASALEEYERVTASAWEEYKRVTASALAEYKRVKASTWEEYERVTASAWEEYERVTAHALAEYYCVKAAVCISLYIKQCEEEQ